LVCLSPKALHVSSPPLHPLPHEISKEKKCQKKAFFCEKRLEDIGFEIQAFEIFKVNNFERFLFFG
jgi:hypothetical protein